MTGPESVVWVREDVVLAVHLRQLAEHGGGEGVRDEGLLRSALARPQNLLAYGDPPPDLASLAAAYAYGIARNHPFVDGNKRTALVVARLFLLLNGVNLVATQEEKYLTFLKLADGELSEGELTNWVRAHLNDVSKEGG
jgi:death-on-curing protein